MTKNKTLDNESQNTELIENNSPEMERVITTTITLSIVYENLYKIDVFHDKLKF